VASHTYGTATVKQKNGIDCGAYACMYMHAILRTFGEKLRQNDDTTVALTGEALFQCLIQENEFLKVDDDDASDFRKDYLKLVNALQEVYASKGVDAIVEIKDDESSDKDDYATEILDVE
jgi:Ulp1 family protease